MTNSHMCTLTAGAKVTSDRKMIVIVGWSLEPRSHRGHRFICKQAERGRIFEHSRILEVLEHAHVWRDPALRCLRWRQPNEILHYFLFQSSESTVLLNRIGLNTHNLAMQYSILPRSNGQASRHVGHVA